MGLRVMVWIACMAPMFAVGAPADVVPSGRVELVCKIKPADGDLQYKVWTIELRRSSGEPIRRRESASGVTVKFGDLDPGIYMLCLLGRGGRPLQCRSFDLRPAPIGEARTFY